MMTTVKMTTNSVAFKRRRRKSHDCNKTPKENDYIDHEAKNRSIEDLLPATKTITSSIERQERKFMNGEMRQQKHFSKKFKRKNDEYFSKSLKNKNKEEEEIEDKREKRRKIVILLSYVYYILIIAKLIIISQVECNETLATTTTNTNTNKTTATYYYANLPKLGYISGPRLKVDHLNNYVAAFLGIPYAAPPTGLLRLMPPGALVGSSSNVATTQIREEERYLLPLRQRLSVRVHSEFGNECVRLSDWLPEEEEKEEGERSLLQRQSDNQLVVVSADNKNQSSNSLGFAEAETNPLAQNNNNEDSSSKQKREEIETEGGRKKVVVAKEKKSNKNKRRQSEDCLNLNVFIPINKSNNGNNNNKNKQTKSSDQKHQIKLNYPSQYFANLSNRTTTTTTNAVRDELVDNKEEFGDQDKDGEFSTQLGHSSSEDTNRPLWSIKSERDSEKKLPVLVLFHGTNKDKNTYKQEGAKPNTLSYLSATHLLNSIVITFNYRIGLLGFLPYIDEEASFDGLKSMPRSNHAIWDQLGLLHWLKHNVASFQGDPNNIALLPVDNQAAQFVQLLTLSPLAKGLFNRIFLVHDEIMRVTNNEEERLQHLNLNQMIHSNDEMRDLRRRLTTTLSSIVKQLTKQQQHSGRVFDFIQSASIPKLAQLDQQLNQLGSEQLVAIANEPTLNDRVLFPYIISTIPKSTTQLQMLDSNNAVQQSGRLNQTILQSEINYCLYIRNLAINGFDPFNLLSNLNNITAANSYSTTNQQQVIPVKQQQLQSESGQTKSGWQRDNGTNNNNNSTKQIPTSNKFSKRAQTAVYFNHLQQVISLNRFFLNNFGSSSTERWEESSNFDIYNNSDYNFYEDNFNNKQQQHSYEEDKQHSIFEKKSRKRSYSNNNNEDSSSSLTISHHHHQRRTIGIDFDDFIRSNLNQLMTLMPSFDLMIGYIRISDNNHHHHQEFKAHQSFSKDFQNIANILVNSSNHLDEQLVSWLKFSDYHFVANLASNKSNLAQLCNLDNILAKSTPSIRTCHVFIIDSDELSLSRQKNQEQNWLLNSLINAQMVTGLANFIKYGNLATNYSNRRNANEHNNYNTSNYWPIYNSLSRKIKHFPSNITSIALSDIDLMKQIRIKLDILPYLSILNTFQNVYKNNTTDLEELLLCLSDIDTAISESKQNIISNVVDNNYSTPILMDRIQGHLKCLTTSSLRFKNRVRQYGSDDLEPLIRHINSKLHRYLGGRDNNGASSSSSITTRNLVDEGPILNNLEQSDASSQLEMEVASSNGSSLIAYVSSNNNLQQDNNPNSSGSSFSFKKNSLGGIKGFLENALKDPVGKTLTFVVGTGLSILLLNLIIVAIITLRSSRTRRAAAAAQSNPNNDFLTSSPQNETDDDIMDGFETLNNNNKKSTLKKSRVSDIDSNKSQTLNSSFKSNQTTNLRSTKQLKFDLTGVPIRKNFQEDFVSSNNNQTNKDVMQMVEFEHQNNHSANNLTECYPIKDEQQMMLETMMNNFEDTGILLSISPMLTKCNPSCLDEFFAANNEKQQQQHQEQVESELEKYQKFWPNKEVTKCNEYYYRPCNEEQQDMTTYYGGNNDSDSHYNHHHHHHHHHQYNSTNSPITSTQSNSTITTICPNTNTTSSFNASSMLVDQKRARDLPACSSSSQYQLNKLPCFHQQANYIQNQSTGSPGSSATLSITPIPIQLESLALTTQQGNHLHQNFHLDSVYQIDSQASFVPSTSQTGQQQSIGRGIILPDNTM